MWCFGRFSTILGDLVPFVQFQKRENTHGEVLLLVKLQVFSLQLYSKEHSSMSLSRLFKLYKWYQIAQRIIYFSNIVFKR